jgi:hypothetical protein
MKNGKAAIRSVFPDVTVFNFSQKMNVFELQSASFRFSGFQENRPISNSL